MILTIVSQEINYFHVASQIRFQEKYHVINSNHINSTQKSAVIFWKFQILNDDSLLT